MKNIKKSFNCLACKDKGNAQPYCCYCGMPYKEKVTSKHNESIPFKELRHCKTCGQELVTKKENNGTLYLCPKIVNSWFLDYSETHSNYAIYDNGMMLNFSTACEPY